MAQTWHKKSPAGWYEHPNRAKPTPDKEASTMGEITPTGNVVQFPTPPDFDTAQRLNSAAIRAVYLLADKGLCSEVEAVKSLMAFGATDAEIDLLRTILSIRRGRVG